MREVEESRMSQAFGLSNWVDRGAIYWQTEEVGVVWGQHRIPALADLQEMQVIHEAMVVSRLDLRLRCRGKIRARGINRGPTGTWIVFQVTGWAWLLL